MTNLPDAHTHPAPAAPGTAPRFICGTAEVTAVKDGALTLKAGVLQMKVKADEVRLIEEAERAATAKKQPQFAPSQRILRTASAARELDIRGMETLEAESVLDNYIDAAVMAHLETVTIIHGKGTGALRAAVHQLLKRSKQVKSFRLGRYGEGEAGVTVVAFSLSSLESWLIL